MVRFSHDHPTYTDALSRERLLQEVGERIKTCHPPQVIGVYGDWGSGKTSFLRSLRLYLGGTTGDAEEERRLALYRRKRTETPGESEEDDWHEGKAIDHLLNIDGAREGYPVIWFEAWRYQGEEMPVVALLHEVRRQFSAGTQVWEMLKKDARIALESSLLALEPLAKAISFIAPAAGFFGKALGNVSQVAEKREKERYEVPLSTDQIRTQLNQAMKTIVKTIGKDNYDPAYFKARGLPVPDYEIKKRLTIIIDDLDRCEPEMALKLLEGIKLFLGVEQCVFVLGVNPRRLADHIAGLYRASADDDEVAKRNAVHAAADYLDKIINVHYALGLPTSIRGVLERHMPEVLIIRGSGGTDLTDDLKEIILKHRCLPPNPRKVKGYLNTLARYARFEWEAYPEPELLVAFAYLNHFHPDIVRRIQFYPGYAARFFAWCRKPDDAARLGLGDLAPFRIRPGTETGTEAYGYPDPIYEKVLYVQPLLAEWSTTKNVDDYDLTPYILLG